MTVKRRKATTIDRATSRATGRRRSTDLVTPGDRSTGARARRSSTRRRGSAATNLDALIKILREAKRAWLRAYRRAQREAARRKRHDGSRREETRA
jgi:hypothetical protein